MPWAPAIAAVGAVAGAEIQGSSADKAAGKQQKGTDQALAEERRQYDQNRADLAPYREIGVENLGKLNTEINNGITPEEVISDPGYAFGQRQGQLALDRKASAAGGRVSGASLKSAAQYGVDYAATGYNAAYQRRQDRLNRLATLAGIGQTAAGTGVAAGSRSADNISDLLASQGDASAAASLSRGNIWANTGNQLAAIGSRWARSDTPNWAGARSDVDILTNDKGLY